MSRFKAIPEAHLLLFRGDSILLLKRFNTGYEDGKYSVVAGHIEAAESATRAMAREALEEAGLVIRPEALRLRHAIYRNGTEERISFFFGADRWEGEPVNREPHKCSELAWFPAGSLPANMVPYVRHAIEQVALGEIYSEFGWPR